MMISGKALVLEFSDDGKITGSIVLDVAKGNYGAEIGPGIYHSILSLASGTVVFEIKEGPYLPATVKYFAPWAPEEESHEVESYLGKLIKLSGAV